MLAFMERLVHEIFIFKEDNAGSLTGPSSLKPGTGFL